VAFDISVLGAYFDRFDSKHGIARVVEEVLIEICKRNNIEMTAVGLCGDDPLADSIKALLYLEHKKPALSCGFSYTFRVSPGLTKLYTTIFRTTLAGALDRMPPRSTGSISLRAIRSLLYRMVYKYRVVQLHRVFDYQNFDVFHCPHLGLLSRDVTRDLPRIVTIYDLIPLIRRDFVRDIQLKIFQNLLDKIDVDRDWVTCISDFTRQEFCEYTGMARERVFVTPLAASDHFRPITDREVIAAVRSRYGLPEGQYFLSLAAPQPRKNLVHLIRSFFRMLEDERLSDTYLVLAGSKEQGWMFEEIFAAAESLSKQRSRIVFTGYVHDEDLPALYSGAVAFVFPSLYEGFGLPPLEAMACGTPVITSNTSSLPEVVGGAGLMVDPHDEDALSQAMLDVLNNGRLRQELNRRGTKRAAEFSWEKCADETIRVYEAAVAEHRQEKQ
jgi:glycosyltransferase involved in cell wall biosynthesis